MVVRNTQGKSYSSVRGHDLEQYAEDREPRIGIREWCMFDYADEENARDEPPNVVGELVADVGL